MNTSPTTSEMIPSVHNTGMPTMKPINISTMPTMITTDLQESISQAADKAAEMDPRCFSQAFLTRPETHASPPFQSPRAAFPAAIGVTMTASFYPGRAVSLLLR